jgi:hypothetical protein
MSFAALVLLEKIAGTENWGATPANPHWRSVSRQQILNTYADALLPFTARGVQSEIRSIQVCAPARIRFR